MKRASTTPLPRSISAIRLVAWQGEPNATLPGSIIDISEFTTAALFRKMVKQYADMTAGSRSVEVVSDNPLMTLKATVEKGIPEGCRTEQACIRFYAGEQYVPVLLTPDRFWDLMCETATEMQGPSHFCNDECRCNNE